MRRGRFLTPLDLRDAGNGRHFELLARLIYQARDGTHIAVPAGFVTDLASIPRGLWNLLPPLGKYDYAAVVHDYLYRTDSIPLVTQREADRTMLYAMEDSPHPPGWLTRWVVYLGVRIGGNHAFHQHPVAWRPADLR